jgi:Peptidase family M48
MRALCLSLFLGFSAPAWCADIVDVLVDSNNQRLQARTLAGADSERAATVRTTWQRLLAVAAPEQTPELRVVTGALYAEAVMGRMVVASEALAELTEGQRMMMLAHELGHVALGHWDDQCRLYKRFIPGEVRPETTDPVAGRLGAAAHTQAHRHEFEADAYGYALVRGQGVDFASVMTLLMSLGAAQDSVTHPGTHRRVAHLREIEARGVGQGEVQAAATGPLPQPAE